MKKLILFILCFTANYAIAQNDTFPKFSDIIIDEILSDPNPVVGLPDAEFIEIKNISAKNIDITGFKLTSSSSVSKAFPAYILPADSFLIITHVSDTNLFKPFGNVLGITSFPALNNSGTTLSLISKQETLINSVSYNNAWFRDDAKSNGGWSLEMTDTKNTCSGAGNWNASTDPRGGTPGTKNSVDAPNPDNTAPVLLRAAATDSLHVNVTFSKPVDSVAATLVSNYNISDGINVPAFAITVSPAFTNVLLTLSAPLVNNKLYTVTANNISDCSGNIILALNTVKFGLPVAINSFDIIINEVLFNPKSGGVDFVEIYNRSNQIFNLKDLYVANRSASNILGTLRQITADNILMFPGDFFVISENGALVKQNFIAKNPDNFIDVAMPSFPNEEGTVVLLNDKKEIIDELHYNADWHFALIDNEKGISLERIDYNKPSQNKDNWTSAASTTGFATPGYQNSQFRADVFFKGDVTVTPKTFSPDFDGFEDFTTINYQMPSLGYVANITIFDAGGKPVKYLTKNATLAQTGTFKWDGLNDKSVKVPVGIYVIYTEVFNLNGKKKSFKNTVIVGGRL